MLPALSRPVADAVDPVGSAPVSAAPAVVSWPESVVLGSVVLGSVLAASVLPAFSVPPVPWVVLVSWVALVEPFFSTESGIPSLSESVSW